MLPTVLFYCRMTQHVAFEMIPLLSLEDRHSLAEDILYLQVVPASFTTHLCFRLFEVLKTCSKNILSEQIISPTQPFTGKTFNFFTGMTRGLIVANVRNTTGIPLLCNRNDWVNSMTFSNVLTWRPMISKTSARFKNHIYYNIQFLVSMEKHSTFCPWVVVM